MEIQEYLIEDVKTDENNQPFVDLESAEEYQRITESLGLEGQKKLLHKDDTDELQVIPFQAIPDTELRVWESFCPGKHALEKYDEGLIPLRVLALIELCVSRKYFDRIEIRTESETNPDLSLIHI